MISVFNKKEDCCGCTACKHICPTHAIEVVSDEEGFLYPEINQKFCVNCGLCKEVCAFQKGYDISTNFKPPEVYAAKHKKEDIRMSSTSGGAFTAISDFILENEGVIFGVAFDENMDVIHRAAKTSNERNMFRGSKYVQSDLKDVYKEIKKLLNEGRQVFFTGTPCQTAGLKSFLAKDNTEKLILCDIVCHGVPSPLMWREHIKHLEAKNRNKILVYNFRDKLIGWRGANVTIKFADRMYKNNSLARTYTNLYFSHNILRPACHSCKYTNMVRPSDITIADFWGIEKHMPKFDDYKGISLVLVNSTKGKKIFQNIEKDLILRESNEKDCLQPQLREPSKPSPNREKFWKEYKAYGYDYVIKKYGGYNLKNIYKMKIKVLLNGLGLLTTIKRLRND
jgi:coenzyme F420-reducing hydrogenase beta subunit